MYIQLSSNIKLSRIAQILSNIGSNANLSVYAGQPPISPEYATTQTLLVTLALPSPAAVLSQCVAGAIIDTPGTGGSNGVQTITGTTGTGTRFQAVVEVVSGAIAAILSVTTGSYSQPPANIQHEPVTGGGLTGATLALLMTAKLTFSQVFSVNAVASGTAGWARISDSSGHGVIDLDCGLSNASIVMNSLQVTQGQAVSISPSAITES